MKTKLLLSFFLCMSGIAFAQKNFNDYAQFYPIGEDPTIRWMSSYTKQETILAEINPTVRYSVFNNFMKGLMQDNKHTQAWYVLFGPQLRVYDEISFPVKTPSYKMFFGSQHLFRLRNKNASEKKVNFLGVSFQAGHYSNGQENCAFSKDFAEDSRGNDSIYNLINSSTDLTEILNRRSGNFSTNLTELILNYRQYDLNEINEPLEMQSFNLGYVLYQKRFLGVINFGGYSDQDIKIYGKHRFLLGYEYMKNLKKGEGLRFSFKQNIEIIQSAHAFVNPLRSESIITIYPFINFKKYIIRPKAIGFFVSYIYGHDNYNYRVVDSGHQITIGISWNQFPPFPLRKKANATTPITPI